MRSTSSKVNNAASGAMTAAAPTLHLVKLCVGVDSIETLRQWQAKRPRCEHITRMTPTRQAELLAGGSLYWVIAGAIRARQRLLGIAPVTGSDGKTRCHLLLDRELVATKPWPRRPFQGWRYLPSADAPPDLGTSGAHEMPEDLRAELSALGLL